MSPEEYVTDRSFSHPLESDGTRLVTLGDSLWGIQMAREDCKVKIGKLERLLRVILKNRGMI